MTIHQYCVNVQWTGNLGQGTTSYRAYHRNFEITHSDKEKILGSADPAYLGDKTRWNPEDLLVASASACHKLWYLHLCAVNQICVLEYCDHAEGYMQDEGKGHITQIVLKPQIKLALGSNKTLAEALHQQAHHECMIANSVNFPIECEPTFYD